MDDGGGHHGAGGNATGRLDGNGLGIRSACMAIIVCMYVLLPVPMLLGQGMMTAIAMNFLLPVAFISLGVVWSQRTDHLYRASWSTILYVLLTSLSSAPMTLLITGMSSDQCPVGFDCYAHVGGLWLYVDFRSVIDFAILYLISCMIGVALGLIVRAIRRMLGRRMN